MQKHTLTGNIKTHRAFRSRILGNRRDILVYLPPGYRRFSRRRYPVFYLQDGQNVFDAATSFAGVEWGVDETAERLSQQNYRAAHCRCSRKRWRRPHPRIYADAGGNRNKGKKEETEPGPGASLWTFSRLKNSNLTSTENIEPNADPEFTGVGGSSLGGLVTLAIGLLYPQVFRRLMVMSPSVWWDDFAIYRPGRFH